jgi:hypothetical protein
MWARTGFAVLSFLATAAFLFLDLQDIKLGGQAIAWQVPALISLAFFGVLVTWHIYSLNSDLHKPERQIDVVIRPDPPLEDGEWFAINTIEDTHKNTVRAYLDIDMRNNDSIDRTVNEIYLELRPSRRWWGWPIVRREMVRAVPVRVDHDLNWYERERPSQVDWTIPAGGATVTHNLHLEHGWESATGKLPKWMDLHLVMEIGGRSHKRRFDLEAVKG